MKRIACIISPMLIAAASDAVAAPTPADLRDYSLAACLIRQTASRDLQTEGYRLADIVLTRAGISPMTMKPLDTAVGAALVKHRMLMVHVDGPVAQSTQPAPLASCLRVIESSSVQATMRTLMRPGKR